jgi:cyclase
MRLSPSCYAVTGLGYSAPWSVNAGIISGEHTTLIVDTGGCALSAATVHGYARAVALGNAIRAINTEPHFDHIGGNSYVSRFGVEIWGHAAIQRTQEEFRHEIQEFNDAIPDRARRDANEAEVFFSATHLKLPDHAITADTTFDLGSCSVEILLTPGHTPANLCVWHALDRVLMCGDTLVNGYAPNLTAGSPADWETWLRSLDRIAALNPQTVLPGHGPVATGDDVSRLIDRHRRFLTAALQRAGAS